MSSGTRSQTISGGHIVTLVGLSTDQVTTLDGFDIKTIDDIATLEKSDYDQVLGTANTTFMVRRRLSQVSLYLRNGGRITSSTTMAHVMQNITGPGNAPLQPQRQSTVDRYSSPIKLSPTDVPEFSGHIKDQEKYRTQIEAMVGQTAFKFLLKRDAVTPEEKERDEELFNVFKASFHDGTAYHIITSSLTDQHNNPIPPSGRRVWEKFLTWCNSGGRKDALRKQLEKELDELKLDGDLVDGFAYVNSFITKHDALKRIGIIKDTNTKMQRFVDNITDEDFDVVQQSLNKLLLKADRDGTDVNPQEFFDDVEARQRTLSRQADDEMEIKSRRQQAKRGRGSDSRSTSGYNSDRSTSTRSEGGNLFTIPTPIFNSLSYEQKKSFNKWRKSVRDGSAVEDSVYASMLNNRQGNSGTRDRDNDKSSKGKKKKRRALKLCRTVNSDTCQSETEEVQLLMKSDDDYSDDSDDQGTSTGPNDKRKVAVTRIIRKSTPNPLKDSFSYQTILDSGTEWTVVGGPAWAILSTHKRSLNIAAVDSQMSAVKTQLCDAVTSIRSGNGTILLGVRRCGFSPSLSDNEAVVNSHLLREAGWKVDEVAKRHGGTQSISIRDENIPLGYNATCYKMYLACRVPTQEELQSMPIYWIDCHIEDLAIDDGKQPCRRVPRTDSPSFIIPGGSQNLDHELQDTDQEAPLRPGILKPTLKTPPSTPTETSVSDTKEDDLIKEGEFINWNLTLGHCNDEVVRNTLQKTTQYFAKPVESEVRAYPRQHRQRRLHPLHYKRLRGRTSADTFFSSVRSVRGYTCVQLFVALIFDFLWVKVLRRESQVPGSYQDFCNEVGMPNELITDNSKVQSGKKFAKINRENRTKHIFSTPHCQNQNPAERKIQDVKHRAILVLYQSGAPLVFWCYAIQFVTDCLNHTSKSKLDKSTPIEMLTGNTPDISMFRYAFWQPIEYLDPSIKFPDCKWKPGRFVGIAWKHGDPLTYKIWTEPDAGGWEKGSELVRNVVRPRVLNNDKHYLVNEACTKSELDEFVLVPDRERHTLGLLIKKRKQNRTVTSQDTLSNKKRKLDLAAASHSAPDSGEHGSTKLVTFENENLSCGTSNHTPAVQDSEESESITMDSTNLEESEDEAQLPDDPIELTDEINNELDPNRTSDQKDHVIAFNGQRWTNGKLQLRMNTSSDDSQWVDFRDAKEDHPRKVAQFIVDHYKTRSKKEGRDRVISWAKKVLRDYDRAVRRIARLYDFVLNDDDTIRKVRRAVRAKKKKLKGKPPTRFKYGVQVPRNIMDAQRLDQLNGNTLWMDAVQKEMQALYDLDCFEFREAGYNPGSDYQVTRLHLIFDVKNDLRRKARLVAGGHLVDLFDTEVYSSTVKGISVKLLHVIAHQKKLTALCGDVGNAFVTAETREKVYCIAGLEFGEDKQGQTVIIRKALYGLASSAACFHAHFADVLRSFGFRTTRFDQDIWYKLGKDKKTYNYVCTHVDDFCIFSKNPQPIMDQIKSIFTIKGEGPPEYYLGNDYKRDSKGRWNIGCKTYIKEGVARIEKLFEIVLPKRDIPMSQGDHPELDTSVLLGDSDHTKYQMLIGMLNWIVTIGRIDIAFAVTSLSRFVASPREGHMKRALHVFGYLKKKMNKRIIIDSRDPIIVRNGAEHLLDVDLTEKLEEFYPDSKEEIDEKVPEPLLDELKITAYVDSDHAHDKVTRRSMTGLIIFVGRTPVFYMAKRQGAIETSTYGAEFIAMKTAVEEVISVRYMLRCLGVRITSPTHILGDNRSVILNSTVPSSLLKKKHIAIAYHKTREAAAAGIVHPIKTKGEWNFADVCTKSQTRKIHATLVNGMLS